jgi:hypothetical protein
MFAEQVVSLRRRAPREPARLISSFEMAHPGRSILLMRLGSGWRGERRWSYSSRYGGSTSSERGRCGGIARRLAVHRWRVRQALANGRPTRTRTYRERPVIAPLIPLIDAILQADGKAPRKQRHTARRIWQRILTEMPEPGSGGSDASAIRARAQTGAGVVSARPACHRATSPGRKARLVRSLGRVEP